MHKLDKSQGRESYKAGSSSPESPLLWWKSGDDWQEFSYTLDGGSLLEHCINRFFAEDCVNRLDEKKRVYDGRDPKGYQRPLATSERARGLGRIDIPGTKDFLKWLSYPRQVVIGNFESSWEIKKMAELLVSRPLLPTPAKKTFHNKSVNKLINRGNLVGKPRPKLRDPID